MSTSTGQPSLQGALFTVETASRFFQGLVLSIAQGDFVEVTNSFFRSLHWNRCLFNLSGTYGAPS